MSPTPEYLEALEELERDGLPGLVEVLHQEGLDAIRLIESPALRTLG